jgi:hypothetical protein
LIIKWITNNNPFPFSLQTVKKNGFTNFLKRTIFFLLLLSMLLSHLITWQRQSALVRMRCVLYLVWCWLSKLNINSSFSIHSFVKYTWISVRVETRSKMNWAEASFKQKINSSFLFD